MEKRWGTLWVQDDDANALNSEEILKTNIIKLPVKLNLNNFFTLLHKVPSIYSLEISEKIQK